MTTNRIILLAAELLFPVLFLTQYAFIRQDPRRHRVVAGAWFVLGAGCLVYAGGLFSRGDVTAGWVMVATALFDAWFAVSALARAERARRDSCIAPSR